MQHTEQRCERIRINRIGCRSIAAQDDLGLRAAMAGEMHDVRTVLEERILQVVSPRRRLEDRLECIAMARQANPLLDRAIFLIERELVTVLGICGEEEDLEALHPV